MGTMLDTRPLANAATLDEPTLDGLTLDDLAFGARLPATQPATRSARGFALDPLPVAPQPIRRLRHHYARAATRLFKGALILLLVPLLWLAAGYAGLLHALPATPPGVRVAGDGQLRAAVTGPYCWFLPGQALCAGADAASAPHLPLLTVAQNQTLSFAFGAPAPTRCGASAAPLASGDGPEQIADPLTRLAAGAPRGVNYQLLVGLAPGLYRLDVDCQWDTPPLLRWLQGQGNATYAVVVRVVAVRRPASRIAPL